MMNFPILRDEWIFFIFSKTRAFVLYISVKFAEIFEYKWEVKIN
jgi:hypothetical protein